MDITSKIVAQLILVLVVISVLIGSVTTWFVTNEMYMNNSLKIASVKQLDVNKELMSKEYPKIQAKNLRVKYKSNFNISSYVTATNNGVNISNKLKFYGNVDTYIRGIYVVRCVVINDLGLKTVKNIQVVVD